MPLKDPEARKVYHREYMQRYLSSPDTKRKHLERVFKNQAKYRKATRLLVECFKKQGCSLCSETDPVTLDAHHLKDKTFNVGTASGGGYSPAAVAAELAKCVCICSNCHRKVHAGRKEVLAKLQQVTHPSKICLDEKNDSG